MSDGVEMKVRGLDQALARMRKIAPALDEEMDKANAASLKEMVGIARRLAPKGATGDLARSFEGRKIEGGAATFTDTKRKGGTSGGGTLVNTSRTISATSSWGFYALWRWTFSEFGTRRSKARPAIFPAFRLIRKRHIGRMRRAMSKALKRR